MKLPKELQNKDKKNKKITNKINFEDFEWDFINNKIRQLSEKLQIQWDIRIVTKPIDGKFKNFHCSSYPEYKHHVIFLSPYTVKNFVSNPLNLYNLSHELCHFSLCEKIDPAYSSLIWSKDYKQGYDEGPPLLEDKMLELAWSGVIEFWADDLCHSFWPEECKLNHKDFFEAVREEAIAFQNLSSNSKESYNVSFVKIKLAQIIAREITLAKRFNFKSYDYSSIIQHFGDDFIVLINNLIKFYKSDYFQQLSYNKKKDLALLLEAVKESIKMCDFPIKPKLFLEEGLYVWRVD